jgi:hypothetical protein
MREAYYSIDVSWDGDDVERRLVECGVLERWKAGEIGSVECVMGGWELSAGKDRESFCCGVYHAPAALQAGGGLVPTAPLSIGPAQTRQPSIGPLAHLHARLTSTFVFCTPQARFQIFGLCIGLTLYLSLHWHPSSSASQVCCDV